MTYQLYIGANNVTKEVETDKIEAILNSHYEGYTLLPSVGYWLGKKENSVVVTLVSDQATLKTVLKELKEELQQDAIGWQQVNNLNFA